MRMTIFLLAILAVLVIGCTPPETPAPVTPPVVVVEPAAAPAEPVVVPAEPVAAPTEAAPVDPAAPAQ